MTVFRRCTSARIALVKSCRRQPSLHRTLYLRLIRRHFKAKTTSCSLRRRDVTSNSSTKASESSTEQITSSLLSTAGPQSAFDYFENSWREISVHLFNNFNRTGEVMGCNENFRRRWNTALTRYCVI